MKPDHTATRIRRLASVSDYDMRNAIFAQFFSDLSDTELSSLLDHLDMGLRQQNSDARSIVHSLFLYWRHSWGDWMERVALLPNTPLTVNLRHQTHYGGLEAWKVIESEAIMFADDKVLTLGERRANARIPQQKTIETYLFDPDLLVIKNLLQNPRITEADVIRIAARRPTTANALLGVYESRRFGLSKTIMLALLQNPFLPYLLAIGLTHLMSKTDLKGLKRVHSLSPTLKKFVARRLAQLENEMT